MRSEVQVLLDPPPSNRLRLDARRKRIAQQIACRTLVSCLPELNRVMLPVIASNHLPHTPTICGANCGALAQLGEHLLCKQGVIGSIPIRSTIPDLTVKHFDQVFHRPIGRIDIV